MLTVLLLAYGVGVFCSASILASAYTLGSLLRLPEDSLFLMIISYFVEPVTLDLSASRIEILDCEGLRLE